LDPKSIIEPIPYNDPVTPFWKKRLMPVGILLVIAMFAISGTTSGLAMILGYSGVALCLADVILSGTRWISERKKRA
jgi:uncharacterized membrane protein